MTGKHWTAATLSVGPLVAVGGWYLAHMAQIEACASSLGLPGVVGTAVAAIGGIAALFLPQIGGKS